MPSSETLIAFLLATVVFAYMPGPATLYTAAQTLAHGRRAGWFAVLGLHIGGYFHVVAAAFGISVLFNVVPLLFSIFKLLGAGYLIWLGIRLFRSNEAQSDQFTNGDTPKGERQTFRQSITVELLNPKTAIFYIAFLPQFTDPSADFALWGQLLILGTVVNILFSSADVVCVLLSSTILKYFNESPSGSRIAQRIGGGILMCLGIHLALSGQ